MVLDEVDEKDGKDYIEMVRFPGAFFPVVFFLTALCCEPGADYSQNLGLGVLEEKRGDNEVSSNNHESGGEGADGVSGSGAESSNKKSKERGDSNVLDKLMGGKQSDADKPSIEEMAD